MYGAGTLTSRQRKRSAVDDGVVALRYPMHAKRLPVVALRSWKLGIRFSHVTTCEGQGIVISSLPFAQGFLPHRDNDTPKFSFRKHELR